MSIIYDALKKVEGKFDESSQDKENFKPREKTWMNIFLGVMAIGAGFFIAAVIFNSGFFDRFIKGGYNVLPPAKSIITMNDTKTPPIIPLEKSQPATETGHPKDITPEESATKPILNEVAPTLTLNGVFFSENEGYALINNQIVREGDTISGAEVVRITMDGVELKANGRSIKLLSGKKQF